MYATRFISTFFICKVVFMRIALLRYASKQKLYKPKERTDSGKQIAAFSATVIPVDLKNLNVSNCSKK